MPRPVIDMDACDGCGVCSKVCPVDAISMKSGKPYLPPDAEEACLGCRSCLRRCPLTCISFVYDDAKRSEQKKPKRRLLFGSR